ncbi:MAG: hypothetical protein JOY84_02930 [Curvibacter sp.]|nr:hypothetical protein [Curvibacter sp.]
MSLPRRFWIFIGIGGLACSFSAQALAAGGFYRSSGYWEVTVRKAGQPEVKVFQCTDQKVEPLVLMSVAAGQSHCDPAEISLQKDVLRIRTLCQVHGRSVKTDLRLNGNRVREYQGTLRQSWFDPAGQPLPQEGTTTVTGRLVGPCPSEAALGDMTLSNGVIVNVIQDAQRHEEEVNAHAKD